MSGEQIPPDWAPLLEHLATRRSTAQAMGGEDRLARLRGLVQVIPIRLRTSQP